VRDRLDQAAHLHDNDLEDICVALAPLEDFASLRRVAASR
jgi:hypothetical protein